MIKCSSFSLSFFYFLRAIITDNRRYFRVFHLRIDCFFLLKNTSGYASSDAQQLYSENSKPNVRLVRRQNTDKCSSLFLLHRMCLQCLVHVRDYGELQLFLRQRDER